MNIQANGGRAAAVALVVSGIAIIVGSTVRGPNAHVPFQSGFAAYPP